MPVSHNTMIRSCFFLCHRQVEALRSFSVASDIPMSELLRRMIDHCSAEDQLNKIVPAMSGRLHVEG